MENKVLEHTRQSWFSGKRCICQKQEFNNKIKILQKDGKGFLPQVIHEPFEKLIWR